jgi:molybdate transport system substrate-binding protein
MMSPITAISSMATKSVLSALVTHFHAASPHRVIIESVGGVDAAKRVQSGEVFDAVILAANAIDQLTAQGHVRPGSRADLVLSGVSMAVKAGAAQPNISSEAAVKQAVLNAASVGYSTGPSGVALLALFDRWGIKDALQSRLVQAPPGVPVGSMVAQGQVALGFQQLSELLPLPGIHILGALPDAIQILTTFSAGITTHCRQLEATQAWIDFMRAPAAAAIKARHGMVDPT